MKISIKFFQILLIAILFFSIKLKAQTNVIGSTVKIGHLEVAQNDIGTMSHDRALNACADLGNGWRLPTKEELNLFYQNRNKLKGLSRGLGYWTSTEGNDKNYYWIGSFFEKGTKNVGAFVTDAFVECVRPVRDLVNVNSTAVTTKKSNTKVPSGIINGVSQQELLNLLLKSQLSDDASGLDPSSQFYSKPSNSNSRNSSSSSSSENKCKYCFKRQKPISRFDLSKDIYVWDRGDGEMRPGSVLCTDQCGGSGQIKEGAFSSKSLRTCNTCKGSGWIKCRNCKGTGYVK